MWFVISQPIYESVQGVCYILTVTMCSWNPYVLVFLWDSYGRVYTTDPYHALGPAAAAYGVGAMVRAPQPQHYNNRLETELSSLYVNVVIYFSHVFFTAVCLKTAASSFPYF